MSEDKLSFENDGLVDFSERDQKPVLQKPAMAAVLSQVSSQSHPVLARWVDTVVPRLMTLLSVKPAKGMSVRAARDLVAKSPGGDVEHRMRRLTQLRDQSMAVHIINAALGGWTIVERAGLSDEERKMYLAAVTLHDVNKLHPESDMVLTPDSHEAYAKVFLDWGARLGVWDFVDRGLWQDIAFLAQNAESKRGENRTLGNFQNLRHSPGDLEDLATYVRTADLMASVCYHPDDALQHEGTNPLRDEIRRALQHRGQYELRYHKTSENRDLLTQLIHNACLAEAQRAGWVPILYFADGVTYLVKKGSPEPTTTGLPGQVRRAIVEIAQRHTGELIARDGKGIKYKPEFRELLYPATAGRQIISRTLDIIGDKKASVAAERRRKTTLRPGQNVTLDLTYPEGLAVDRLAEAMFALSKLLHEYYPSADVDELLVRSLGMEARLPEFRAIAVTGGVGYHWYYVAGHYVAGHPGLSAADLEALMGAALDKSLEQLGPLSEGEAFGFLEGYIAKVLTWGGSSGPWDFAAELERYETTKARGGRRVCAICNSPFETREDFSIYSNKKVASPRVASGRGICDVCRTQELLRRFALGRTAQQGDNTKYLHFYPSYYFTPLTAKAMSAAYRDLQGVVFQDIAKPLGDLGVSLETLASLDAFHILELPNSKRIADKVEYSSQELHGYYVVGLPPMGRKPTDTESWYMPALLGLLAPILFGAKVVVSGSLMPVYRSGAEFPETVILDGPHPFWQHFMRQNRFRLDELERALPAAIGLYSLTAEAYRDGQGFPVWNQLGSVSRSVGSDLLAVFGYADRIQHAAAAAGKSGKGKAGRGTAPMTATDGLTPRLAERLLSYYQSLKDYEDQIGIGGEDTMSLVKGIVDRYLKFYRPEGHAAFARLRPLSVALEVILDSDPAVNRDDLQLQIEGALHAVLDRVRQGGAQGWVPKEARKTEDAVPLVEDFARFMLDEVFDRKFLGDRAILRRRMNRWKDACEAYYVKQWFAQKTASQAEKE
ncbi:MAG: type I-D CRISPR-associated protein Cas10d/Csc3 [Bacillota bacterium]